MSLVQIRFKNLDNVRFTPCGDSIVSDDQLALAKLKSNMPGKDHFQTVRHAAHKGWLNVIIYAHGKGLLWRTIGSITSYDDERCRNVFSLDGSSRLIDVIINDTKTRPNVNMYLQKVNDFRAQHS